MKSFLLCLIALRFVGFGQSRDQVICNRVFSYAFEHKLIEKPIGEVIGEMGRQFLGAPYEQNTLEQSGAEQLVVNLHGFDCVTFVENILAISRCIKKNRLSFDAFRQELQTLRYRNGRINSYAGRLHYFSDWIDDNQKKGILKDVTREFGGTPYHKTFDFMTSHRDLYRQLANDSAFNQMKALEDTLSHRTLYFIPKSAIRDSQSAIRTGDLIAITTKQEGLDVAHTGIALRMEDRSLHYLHASTMGDVVRISQETLSAYVQKHPSFTGIVVARAAEPENEN